MEKREGGGGGQNIDHKLTDRKTSEKYTEKVKIDRHGV